MIQVWEGPGEKWRSESLLFKNEMVVNLQASTETKHQKTLRRHQGLKLNIQVHGGNFQAIRGTQTITVSKLCLRAQPKP